MEWAFEWFLRNRPSVGEEDWVGGLRRNGVRVLLPRGVLGGSSRSQRAVSPRLPSSSRWCSQCLGQSGSRATMPCGSGKTVPPLFVEGQGWLVGTRWKRCSLAGDVITLVGMSAARVRRANSKFRRLLEKST